MILQQENSNDHSCICQACWQEIHNFHNFYLSIEKAHRNLNTIINSEIVFNDVLNDKEDLYEQIFIDSKENSPLESEILLSMEKDPLEGPTDINKPENNKASDEFVVETQHDEHFNDQNESFESDDDFTSNSAADSSKIEELHQEQDKFIAENFQITCSLCKIPLASYAIMTTHNKEQHNQRGYATCCNQKLHTRSQIVDHIKLHQYPEYFKCKQCDEKLTSRSNLKLHIKNVHETQNNECDICGKSLDNKSSLRTHKLLHDADNKNKIPCKQCDKTFFSSRFLNDHVRLVHLVKKYIICNICGKSLSNDSTYNRHMVEHEGKISCKVCGRILSDLPCLNRHMLSNHPPNGVKPEVKCPVCSKIFTNTRNLKTHVWRVHENKYARKCTLCEKTFKCLAALKDHMAFHTGKPLKACGFCPRKFCSNGNMYTHRKKMHPKEWQESLKKYFVANVSEK